MTVFLADGYVNTPSTTTVVGSDSVSPIPPTVDTVMAIPASTPPVPPPPYVPVTSGGVYRPGLPTS